MSADARQWLDRFAVQKQLGVANPLPYDLGRPVNFSATLSEEKLASGPRPGDTNADFTAPANISDDTLFPCICGQVGDVNLSTAKALPRALGRDDCLGLPATWAEW